jgi:RNA polymerase sigma factor (sigma-70 family)
LLSSTQHNNLNDEELLARYRQGRDNQWLGLLLQRYTMLLLGVALKYLKDRENAEDAVQQIFLKALTQLPQGEILNFKGWLYVLMRNHCLQLLRDKTYKVADDALQYVPAAEDGTEELRWKDYTL